MAETSTILSRPEIEALTGFKMPTKQLNVLHRRGFSRAYISRSGLMLERTHYEAVTRGVFGGASAKERPKANLEWMTKGRR